MDKVVEQLKDLRSIKPSEDWISTNRELLLNQIQTQTSARQSFVSRAWCFVKTFAPTRFMNFVAKPIGVVTMVAVFVIASGGLTVNASRASLPGNILYPVKLTTEKVQIGLTLSPDRKTEMQVANAEERMNEIQQIISSQDLSEEKNKKIEIATDNLKKEVNRVEQSLEKSKSVIGESDDVARAITAVKLVDQKMDELSQKLKLSKEAIEYSDATSKSLAEAQQALDNIGVKVAEVMVTKYDQSGSMVSPSEVKEAIEKQIKNMEDKIVAISEREKATLSETSVPEVMTMDDEVTEEVIDDNEVVVEEPVVENEPINTDEIRKILSEASELLNQGDMLAALEKVKESSGLSVQIEEAITAKLAEMAQLEQEKISDVATEKIEPTIDSGEAVEDNSVVNEQIN